MAVKWKDENYVEAHKLSRSGKNKGEIAAVLGVSHTTLVTWMEKRPALRKAIDEARNQSETGEGQTFQDYVFDRLTKKNQKSWRKIDATRRKKNGLELVENMMVEKGKRWRQQMFLHAMVVNNFNASAAMSMLGMPHSQYRVWQKNDPDFIQLLEEILFHKKNFFEEGLIRKVAEGDTGAVVFANKTLNSDRGYSEKLEVAVSGTLAVEHTNYSIHQLDLPVDVMEEILAAIEEKREAEEAIVDGKLISK